MTCYEVYEAAELIKHGEFQQALDLLETIDLFQRDAKWYYEYCRANAGLERFYEAAIAAKKAHELEPDNAEYKKEWKAYRKHRRPTEKKGKKGKFNVLDCLADGCCECGCECCCEICDGVG